MRRLSTAIATALLAGSVAAAEPAPEWVEQARIGAGALGKELQQALMSAMQEGGAVAAIDVCRIEAPAIAERVSIGHLDVGRTSLSVRNPDNAPDRWEARMLAEFNERLAQGEAPGRIEAFAIRHDGERRYGHWMKAIPTQGLCTACHGTDIQPEVAGAIDAAYPKDEARGFSVGELRGAFSVEVELQSD
ncbi:MAG: DUF3365 domain-containing protein [Gammaproteobacteria bacterium]|jgi:hypothetical protein|nr:DUF3365 domain-containing protein [Gammaproteobacteria bacterium]